MSEMGDSYDPGPWQGYNYKSAWASYDQDAGRGYGSSTGNASSTAFNTMIPSVTLDDLVPATIKTEARSPVVIITDGTGSMGEFPKTIFEKLPLLDLGIEDYLDDAEISVAMIGDAHCDKYPLQVQQFTKGKGLVDTIGKLKIEGGGGGNEKESYDLAALYYARNCEMPKATKPVLIYICDEGVYETVSKDDAKNYTRIDLEKSMKTKELFDELKQKYSVYCIRKHYGDQMNGEQMTGSNLSIQKQWEGYVGASRIAILNDPRRVVDVIFGLLAHETGKEDFFDKELSYRQTPQQVATVQKSLLTVGKARKALPPAGKSVLKKKS